MRLEHAVRSGKIVIIETTHNLTSTYSAPHQIIVDLVNLDRSRHPQTPASYGGVCQSLV